MIIKKSKVRKALQKKKNERTKLKVCRRQTNIDRRAGVLSEPNPPCLLRRFGEFCATRAARRLSDVLFFRRFLLLRRQKKSAKPGKGCSAPLDVRPTLGQAVKGRETAFENYCMRPCKTGFKRCEAPFYLSPNLGEKEYIRFHLMLKALEQLSLTPLQNLRLLIAM